MIDIQFENVSKKYRIGSETPAPQSKPWHRFGVSRSLTTDLWALKDVSFEVHRGEALGIIGHNGAGKSTVLKLLSNITAPSSGKITIHGKLSALLEVGSGFHPELTGRENVYLSGSILGMARREITKKLDSIIESAGVKPFIDIPVKQYSSGMYVRLRFSIAAHLDPHVLLLDEVLAVGDPGFQEKCKQHIREMHEDGTTLVFISHDLNAVRSLCQRALLLQSGRILMQGTPEEVIRKYTELPNRHTVEETSDGQYITELSIGFYDRAGSPCTSARTGVPLTVQVNYFARQRVEQGALSLLFVSEDGIIIAQWTTALCGSHTDLTPGTHSVEFSCSEFGLQPGVYQIDICVERSRTKEILERQDGCHTLYVEAGPALRGAFTCRTIGVAERCPRCRTVLNPT